MSHGNIFGYQSKSNQNINYQHIKINKAELYPHHRKTEYYHEPFPQLQNQTHEAEHPRNKLLIIDNIQQQSSSYRDYRISPPTSSETRITRDSYFS